MPSGKAAIKRRPFFVPDMGPGNNDTVGKKDYGLCLMELKPRSSFL